MAQMDAYDAPANGYIQTKPSAKQRRMWSAHMDLLSDSTYQRLLRVEPWLRRAVPFLVIIFILLLSCVRVFSLYQNYQTFYPEVHDKLALTSQALSQSIDYTLRQQNAVGEEQNLENQDLQNILNTFQKRYFGKSSPQIAVLDRHGIVVAVSNIKGLLGRPLQEVLSGAAAPTEPIQRSLIFPAYLSGKAVIAALHPLESGQYSVFISQSENEIYAPWRKKLSFDISLFLAGIGVILALLYAYYAQIIRARDTDLITEKIQNRIDMAMARGRCGLWDWNIASGRVYWSRSMYEMLGYVPQDALLSIAQVAEIINPNDADLYELGRELMNGEKDYIDINIPMRHAGGHYVWMRIRAEMAEGEEPHLVGISFDISEQHQFAEQTARADLRIRDAIENISESFVLWDPEGCLVMSNSKFAEYAALPNHILQPGVQRTAIEAMARPARSEYSVESDAQGNFTSIRQMADGSWLKINERRTQDGGLVCIGTDISELKQQQKSLEDSETRLFAFIQDLRRARQNAQKRATEVEKLNESLQAEKERAESANKAKSKFLANMSHELRTPLNAIIGFSEIMLQSTFGPLGSERYHEYMRDIHESGTHLLTLINDMLDMSKIEAGRFTLDCEIINLEPIINEALRYVMPQAQDKAIKVESLIAADLYSHADRRAIRQIFLNILSNAVKFTPAGGTITVKASDQDDHLLFTIADTGIGIPAASIVKLGQPFEQVENEFTKIHAGSGLGLAISRALLEAHKGQLVIKSKENKGTMVSISLPKKS
ncbi:PAS domain-containing sensor histidine kinase [Bartonella sp. DGB2]|uniref:PAS domain-containing sensor histidine kinase n=1 Tax=Bartonella sp. DGB2 TaxID=3388426 RepID=UPI0039901DDE